MKHDNPLIGMKKFVDFGTGLFIFSFFLVDILVLIFGSANGFQRLGSLWVALLLVFFGMTKIVFNRLHNGINGRGIFAEMVQDRVSKVTFSEDKGWLNYMSKDCLEFERALFKKSEIEAFFQELKDGVDAKLIPNELFIGALATLQWGYGELIFVLVHGQ